MCGPSSFLLSTLPGTSPTGKEAIGGGNMDHQGKKFDGQRGGQNGTLAARTGARFGGPGDVPSNSGTSRKECFLGRLQPVGAARRHSRTAGAWTGCEQL